MILAPVAGIILNLLDASKEVEDQEQNDIALMFAGMDCAETVLRGFYLMECNWVSNFSSLKYFLQKWERLDMFIHLQNPPIVFTVSSDIPPL